MKLRVFSAACLSLALALGSVSASAHRSDEREDLVRKQQQNNQRIEDLSSSLEGINVDLQKTYLSLEKTRSRIPLAQADLAAAQSDLAQALREQEVVNGQLDAANAELTTIEDAIEADTLVAIETQNSLNELARSAYRGDTTRHAVELWTGSATPEQFLEGYTVIDQVARSQTTVIVDAQTQMATNRNRQARQEVVKTQIVDLQAQADALVVEMDNKRAVAQSRADELVQLEAEEKALAAKLEGERESHEDSIAALESSNKSTAAVIAEIDEENRRIQEEARRRAEEEARRKAEAEARARAQREADARAAEARRQAEIRAAREAAARNVAPAPSSGQAASPVQPVGNTIFVPPVPAPVYVTSPFGMRWYPITGGYYMHNGVDLRSTCGEGQMAAANGVVQAVRPAAGNGTHGNQVYINHGIINGSSYVTVYNHLSGFAVSQGQSVSKGQVIGYTGMTGAVTGCHVHFEIWQNGSVINPMTQPGFTRRN